MMKRHGHTERLSRSDSSNDDKEESSEHHYLFMNIEVKGENEGKKTTEVIQRSLCIFTYGIFSGEKRSFVS
jgi:hypothetical protein